MVLEALLMSHPRMTFLFDQPFSTLSSLLNRDGLQTSGIMDIIRSK